MIKKFYIIKVSDNGIMLLSCLFCMIITWLFYAPGSLSEDSLWQLYQAKNGFVDSGNPPLMSLIWRYIDRYLISGQAGMLLLIIIMYWLGIFLFVSAVSKIKWVRLAGLLLVGFFPPVFGLVGVIWKDIFMLSTFYLSLGLFSVWLSKRNEKWRDNLSILVVSFILLIVCLLTRHNAMFAVFPVLFYYLSVIVKNKTHVSLMLVFMFIISILSVFFISSLQSYIYKKVIPVESNIWQYFMVYDMIGIEVNEPSYRITDQLRKEIISTDAVLSELYTPKLMVPLLFGQSEKNDKPAISKERFPTNNPETLMLIKKEWLFAIVNYPAGYLKHRASFFSNQIGWNDASLYSPLFFDVALDDNYEWGRDHSLKFKPHKIQILWMKCLEILTHSWLYRIYIYSILLVFTFFLGIKWVMNYHDWFLIGLSTSGILNTVNFGLLAISPDFRYNIWTIAMSILSIFYVTAKMVNWRKLKIVNQTVNN